MSKRKDPRAAGRIGLSHGVLGHPSRSRLVLTAVVAVIVLAGCTKKNAANTGAGGQNPNKPAPGGAPAPNPNPPAAPAVVSFYIPYAFELSPSDASDLDLSPGSTIWSADITKTVEALGLHDAFKESGFLSEGQQIASKTGLNTSDKGSWPQGSSAIFEWKVAYFQTNEGAVAAEEATKKNEVGKPVSLPDLTPLGISAFQAVSSTGDGVVTQFWYAVRGNALITVGDSGKFTPGTVQPNQLTLFNDIAGLLVAPPPSSSKVMAKGQAAEAYLAAVVPVNKAEPSFRAEAEKWTSSTTNAKAVAEGAPLLSAFQAIVPQLIGIGNAYPPARAALEQDAAAAAVLAYDLTELSDLKKIGVQTWRQRFDGDIGTLIAISNHVRKALGLPALGP